MSNPLREGLRAHFSPAELARLCATRVGIAGAGGLGSNCAMLLARSGIENMVLVDDDAVEPSNLNRQHFWPRHLGQKKVLALGESLRELNPAINLDLLPLHLDEENLAQVLQECPIWIEALDNAQTKRIFVEKALLAGAFVFAASGLCGVGGQPMSIKRLGRLVVVGDFQTSTAIAPPLAPRVMQAAALMADAALEQILRQGV